MTKKINNAAILICTLILTLFSSQTFSHSRGESYSHWVLDNNNQVSLTYTIKLKDLNLLLNAFNGDQAGWPDRVAEHVSNNIRISTNSISCNLEKPFSHRIGTTTLILHASYLCESGEGIKIENSALFAFDSQHIHFSRLQSDENYYEKVFVYRDTQWNISNSEEVTSERNLLQYFYIGVEHIVLGLDHLAFILALTFLLILLNATLSQYIWCISGFTLGHSISLYFGIAEVVVPNIPLIETLIAYSIALLIIEASMVKTATGKSTALIFSLLIASLPFIIQFSSIQSSFPTHFYSGLALFSYCYLLLTQRKTETGYHFYWLVLITLIFGFIHGFGFSSSLQSIGLPQEHLLLALLSFNLGVEFGQLGILLLLMGTYFLFQKLKLSRDEPLNVGLARDLLFSALICLASFWFFERSVY